MKVITSGERYLLKREIFVMSIHQKVWLGRPYTQTNENVCGFTPNVRCECSNEKIFKCTFFLYNFDSIQASGMRVDCDFAKQDDKMCRSHRGYALELFCHSCDIPICRLCVLKDHHPSKHKHGTLQETAATRRETLGTLAGTAKEKVSSLRDSVMILKVSSLLFAICYFCSSEGVLYVLVYSPVKCDSSYHL